MLVYLNFEPGVAEKQQPGQIKGKLRPEVQRFIYLLTEQIDMFGYSYGHRGKATPVKLVSLKQKTTLHLCDPQLKNMGKNRCGKTYK